MEEKSHDTKPLPSLPDRDERTLARIRNSSQYTPSTPGDTKHPYGFWETNLGNTYHVIGKNSRIDGGILLGSGPREGLVVDSQKSLYLKDLYNKTTSRIEKIRHPSTMDIVSLLVRATTDTLEPNGDGLEKLIDDATPDKELSLDEFIKVRQGNCRHLCVLLGYLLERAVDDHYLNGSITLNRYDIGDSGHMQVLYQQKDLLFEIDPAAQQNRIRILLEK